MRCAFDIRIDMEHVGHHLRRLRQRRKLSLRRVATLAKITAPYLSDIELGRRHPSPRVLDNLAKVLHTPVDELRQNDPKAIVQEVERKIMIDPRWAAALRRLLNECDSADDLLRKLAMT